MSRVIRVFPRRTNATPTDDLAVCRLPSFFDEADEVHVSVTFTYDMPKAEMLATEWKHVAPVRIGGPACDDFGGEFTPGMYLRDGYTITSRGCPNDCWFCHVHKREGGIRELEIKDGWNVLDSNFIACSESHIRAVFNMLARQSKRAEFTGGIEARLMKPWIASEMVRIKTKQLFCAYDCESDYEPLVEAGRMLLEAGFTRQSHALRCYVLCGHKGDTFEKAEKRMWKTVDAGFFPMAMLYRDGTGAREKAWISFQKQWADKIIVAKKIKEREP